MMILSEGMFEFLWWLSITVGVISILFFWDDTLTILLSVDLCSFLFKRMLTLWLQDKLSTMFEGMLFFSLFGMLKLISSEGMFEF